MWAADNEDNLGFDDGGGVASAWVQQKLKPLTSFRKAKVHGEGQSFDAEDQPPNSKVGVETISEQQQQHQNQQQQNHVFAKPRPVHHSATFTTNTIHTEANAKHTTAVALFDYQAQNADCISFSEGDFITVLVWGPGAWWKGTARGNTGWFPSSFVDLVGGTNDVPPLLSYREQQQQNATESIPPSLATVYRPNTFQVRAAHTRLSSTNQFTTNWADNISLASSRQPQQQLQPPPQQLQPPQQPQQPQQIEPQQSQRHSQGSSDHTTTSQLGTQQLRASQDSAFSAPERPFVAQQSSKLFTQQSTKLFAQPHFVGSGLQKSQRFNDTTAVTHDFPKLQLIPDSTPDMSDLQIELPLSTRIAHAPLQTSKSRSAVQKFSIRKWLWNTIKRNALGITWSIIYLIANAIYFGFTYHEYTQRKSYAVLGEGLTIARASGALLKMNCALIFLPVCRNLIAWAYRVPIIEKYTPLDSNLIAHKIIALWIWILATVHSVAHVFNFVTLSNISASRFQEYFKIHQFTNFYEWLLLTVPGLTGVLIWVCQMLIYSSAFKNCRQQCFEVFWFTHHLFIAFTVLTIIHGSAAVFEPPGFWKWLLGPAILYGAERMKRWYRGTRECVVHHVAGEAADVMSLYLMPPKKIDTRPGEYVFLNCPQLSAHQWHPFTLTSSPEEKFLSVHIKAVGTWTKQLHKLFNPDRQLGEIYVGKSVDERNRPLIRVDGPFGTPSEQFFQHKVVVLIGAGIGVTPFASILKSIFYKLLLMQAAPPQYHLDLIPVQKVIFYWVCRERTSFEWFAFLLRDLEDRGSGIFEAHTYLTAKLEPARMASFQAKADLAFDPNTGTRIDPLTGLKSRTYFGRPDFKRIFDDMATVYNEEKIGVFFCGPKVMSRNIKKAARASSTVQTTFVYRKENF